jgi:7-carboxy-7-deazaguanine synthase
MIITEIFKSIQGESSYSGFPCSFIRTTGCNLRCVWCDTQYAFYGGKTMSVDEVLATIEPHQCPLVEITGGEPLVQEEVPILAQRLLDTGRTVLIETGGSLDISVLPPKVIKIVDIKCPESGMMEKMDWGNLERLSSDDEIKFVINSRKDYDWAAQFLKKHELEGKNLILFSPVYGKMNPAELADWILEDHLPVRFQIQLHKVLWGDIPGK